MDGQVQRQKRQKNSLSSQIKAKNEQIKTEKENGIRFLTKEETGLKEAENPILQEVRKVFQGRFFEYKEQAPKKVPNWKENFGKAGDSVRGQGSSVRNGAPTSDKIRPKEPTSYPRKKGKATSSEINSGFGILSLFPSPND